MKQFIEVLIMMISLIAMMFLISLFVVKHASGANGLSGKTTIDHQADTITYNESIEFGVKTTVTVPPSECRVCLSHFPIESCWEIGTCLQVNKD